MQAFSFASPDARCAWMSRQDIGALDSMFVGIDLGLCDLAGTARVIEKLLGKCGSEPAPGYGHAMLQLARLITPRDQRSTHIINTARI